MDNCLLLEVGPGTVLATLARQHPAGSDQIVVSSLANGNSQGSESDAIQQALGTMWLAGIQPGWEAFHCDERRARSFFPTYPFERQRFWIESAATQYGEDSSAATTNGVVDSLESAQTVKNSTAARNSLKEIMTLTAQTARVPRNTTLRKMLLEIFQDLSGID